MPEDTIVYRELSDRAMQEIEKQDPNSQSTWYAKRHAKGYQLTCVPSPLEELQKAQGGPGAGWMRVVFPTEEDVLNSDLRPV